MSHLLMVLDIIYTSTKSTKIIITNTMQNIISSASKLVFLLMAIAACVAFFIGKLDQNNFMILCGAAFSFYFANKGDASQPFAGK